MSGVMRQIYCNKYAIITHKKEDGHPLSAFDHFSNLADAQTVIYMSLSPKKLKGLWVTVRSNIDLLSIGMYFWRAFVKIIRNASTRGWHCCS